MNLKIINCRPIRHLDVIHVFVNFSIVLLFLFPSSLKQAYEIHEPDLFPSGYSQSNHHKRDSHIARSKIFYRVSTTFLYTSLRPWTPCTCVPLTPHLYNTSTRICILNPIGGISWIFFVETAHAFRLLAVFTEELLCCLATLS